MVDTSKLKSIIVLHDMTQESVARSIGMTPKTFYLRMKARKFNSDEIEKMIGLLNIDDPVGVFFVPDK